MFCSKCGTQLDDAAAFCASCGAPTGNNAPAAQSAPEAPVAPAAPAAPAATAPAFSFKLPAIGTLIMLGVALLTFIFGFISWIKLSFLGMSTSVSIFEGDMFDVSFFLGLAKVLMIVQIVLFVLYVAAQFVDFNKFVKLPFCVKEKSGLAYFAVYALALVLALLGIITTELLTPGVGWYLSLVFGAVGCVFTFRPALLDKVTAMFKK